MYFYSNDSTMIDTIVADIQSQQAIEQDASPVVTQTYRLGPWLIIMALGFVSFLIVARRLSE